VHGLASGGEIRARTLTLFDEVGLDRSLVDRYPHELSGGQRQRVSIARALAVEPELLVLDEAVSALDVTTQARILELFEGLRAKRGLTSLFIAHNLAVVQRVASTVAVMYLGRIVELAPASRLFAAPRHPYTTTLIAAVPVPDPSVRRRRLPLTEAAPDSVSRDACAFFPRCPHPAKDAACLAGVPPLAAAEPSHWTACIKEAPAVSPSVPRAG
jgi:oligopeptide/dipeptide ABC transporter ATP-binding protein